MSKVLKVAVNDKNEIEVMLYKFQLKKAIQICAWMERFAHNSLRRQGAPHIVGPLTTKETDRQRLFWDKQAQNSPVKEKDPVALNLQPNQLG